MFLMLFRIHSCQHFLSSLLYSSHLLNYRLLILEALFVEFGVVFVGLLEFISSRHDQVVCVHLNELHAKKVSFLKPFVFTIFVRFFVLIFVHKTVVVILFLILLVTAENISKKSDGLKAKKSSKRKVESIADIITCRSRILPFIFIESLLLKNLIFFDLPWCHF